jgi:sortase A
VSNELARVMRARRRALARARLRRITATFDSDADSLVVEAMRGSAARLAPVEHWKPDSGPAAPVTVSQRAAHGRAAWLDRALLSVEVLGVVGLVAIIALSLGMLRDTQQDVRAMPAATPSARPAGWAVPTATAARVRLTPSPGHHASAGPPPTAVQANVVPPWLRARTVAAVSSPTPTAAPTPDSPTGVRIAIPAIDVDAPVVEGDDWETLKDGIGHRIGTAWPGEAGNSVLSAHVDVFGSIFRRLDALRPGDDVLAHTPAGAFHYEVVSSRVVLPSEVSVTKPTDEPMLTLITCYPPYVDTHRLVVTARLVE